MGGDSEPDEIARFAKFLHRQSLAKVKVGWYSGKQKLPPSMPVKYFQYIKLGPYIEQFGPLKSSNTNQRLYMINEREQMEDITSCFWKQEVFA